MDKLLEQAAKALKIPVDVMEQAVNHYPELRQQFVIYKALTYVENTFDIIGLIAAIVFVCAYFDAYFDGDDIDVAKKANKTRRLSTIVVAVALTIATIIHVVTVVVTPDIQVIMEVINK